jgi:hypothetical protein
MIQMHYVGHKTADSSFFGYKTHIAMNEERIITAAVITTGEKGDGKQLQLQKAVKQAWRSILSLVTQLTLRKRISSMPIQMICN